MVHTVICFVPVEGVHIRYLVEERHINSARISSKSIRLDVYVENREGTVLDIEMQVTGDNSTVYSGSEEAEQYYMY